MQISKLSRFADIERTDSGVGSETSKTSKASVEIRWMKHKCFQKLCIKIVFNILVDVLLHCLSHQILDLQGLRILRRKIVKIVAKKF